MAAVAMTVRGRSQWEMEWSGAEWKTVVRLHRVRRAGNEVQDESQVVALWPHRQEEAGKRAELPHTRRQMDGGEKVEKRTGMIREHSDALHLRLRLHLPSPDLGRMTMSASVWQLPSELLDVWHEHRAEIILTTAILCAIVRLAAGYVLRRQGKSKEALTPPVSSLVIDEKVLAVEDPAKTGPPPKSGPKRVTGGKRIKSSTTAAGSTLPDTFGAQEARVEAIQPILFYYTLGGSTKIHAEALARSLSTTADIRQPLLHDLTEIDYDDFFISAPKPTPHTAIVYLLLIPSYNIDTELSNFLSHLEETHHDFRIDTAPLRGIAGYSVFGIGDRQEWANEKEGYCGQAIEVDKWMARLTGRKRAFPLGMGDAKGDLSERLDEWQQGVQDSLRDIIAGKGLGDGVLGSGEAVESGDEEDTDSGAKPSETADLEDMKVPIPVDFTTFASKGPSKTPAAPKPMVPTTSPTYTSLTKQGYTIVGSHSGVKICRWTKSALRGRGSCYKYSFCTRRCALPTTTKR